MNIWRRRGNLPLWRRGFPFFLATPRSAVERLRSVAARQVWQEGSFWKRLSSASVMTVGWPMVTLLDAARLVAKRQDSETDFVPTFTALYSAAIMRNIPPNQYARYAALPGVTVADLSDFLLPLDSRGLHCLNRQRQASAYDVQNKARFAEICRDHGLPSVPTLASFDHGVATGEDLLRHWTQPFFVKALTGNRGAGAEQWCPVDRGWMSSEGRTLVMDELIEVLRSTNSIVQPVIEDCGALRQLGSVALSSVRLVTAKGSKIAASVVAASLSLATECGALTGHHGIQCGIDIQNGTITKVGTNSQAEEDETDEHDKALLGFSLPFWNECIELVCRAHDQGFPAFVTLGWDVALTSQGPLLLETNVDWGIAPHQLFTGPLGRTSLAGVIDELLGPPEAGRNSADHQLKQDSRSPSPAPRVVRDPSDAKDRTPRRREAKDS